MLASLQVQGSHGRPLLRKSLTSAKLKSNCGCPGLGSLRIFTAVMRVVEKQVLNGRTCILFFTSFAPPPSQNDNSK